MTEEHMQELLVNINGKVSTILEKLNSVDYRMNDMDGRIDALEARQRKVESFVWKITGGLGVALFIVTAFKDIILKAIIQ